MSKIYAPASCEVTQREIEHMELSCRTAEECMVLLENKGVLPLPAGSVIALFGNGARHTVRGGTGSGDVNVRQTVSVETGLINAGFTVVTDGWLNKQEKQLQTAKQRYLEKIDKLAADSGLPPIVIGFSHPFCEAEPVCITQEDMPYADAAVYVIARTSGEGADRTDAPGDYRLYQEEKRQLEQLCQKYKKVIVLLNIGGVMDLSQLSAIKGIGAVLLMGQLGNVGGTAVANVLTGKATPSGKLTDTWAKTYCDYPTSSDFGKNDGKTDDEYYTEGIYVGYRYFDSFGVQPLYPFGYGLSYTSFDIKTGQVSLEGENVSVDVNVKNTGTRYSGKEVVQIYVSAPQTTLKKPYQQLVGFKKTSLLAPGESETLNITFSVRDMASYSEKDASWILENGRYLLRVGTNSRNTELGAVMTLGHTVKTAVLKNLFCDDDHVKEKAAPDIAYPDIPKDVLVIPIQPDAISSHKASYQKARHVLQSNHTKMITATDLKKGDCTAEELVAQLTVEELAELCVGTLRMDETGSIVGNASYIVPGAAGDTSTIITQSRGIRSMILADGPAGLRLQPVFKTTKDGKLLPGGAVFGDITQPFDPGYTDENSNTYYQYCTSIPIGWSLAQSWNLPLLEKIGCMVGDEMELFGVDLWLAPALNIHRDPLCGRNFEYFSEDPVISGKVAAALTNGVQKHPGKGTTVKHFAANNQEENRYFTNSHISERAIREIYLKGFEIAVRDSRPMSVMTSYNLLNGVHTANSLDLLQYVLRDEWGYTGMVMTDWYTSQHQPSLTGEAKYPISASTGCVFAGNDLQMPGCKKNVDDLIEAVKTGEPIDGYRVTLADLQQAVLHIVQAVMITLE